MHRVEWSACALDDMEALFDHLAEQSSAWEAEQLCGRLLRSTDRLVEYPRLYEAAPQYGEGVRRISMLGQHVLYEVNDFVRTVTILAVVGQRQNPWVVR